MRNVPIFLSDLANAVLLLSLAFAAMGCQQQYGNTVDVPRNYTSIRHSPIDDLHLIVLKNSALTLEVAPKIGRIYGLIPTGGVNLLWQNETEDIEKNQKAGIYVNWGGDKVWPELQALWSRQRGSGGDWPPIAPIDGAAWQVSRQDEHQLVMCSPVSDDLSIQITRTIILDASEPRVTIFNTIRRIRTNPLPVMIWSVTQMCVPDVMWMDIATDRPKGEQQVLNLSTTAGLPGDRLTILPHVLEWRPQPNGSYKIGTFGRRLAAACGCYILLQTIEYDPAGCYPDRSNLQVFTTSNYIELETLSPCVHLQAGQTLTTRVEWELLDRATFDVLRWFSPADNQ